MKWRNKLHLEISKTNGDQQHGKQRVRRNTLCIISLMVGTSSMEDTNPSQHPATFAAIVFLLLFRISCAHRRRHACADRSPPSAASSTRLATQILFSGSDPKIHILASSQPKNVSRAKKFKVKQRQPCQHTHRNSQRKRQRRRSHQTMEHSQLQRRLQSHRNSGFSQERTSLPSKRLHSQTLTMTIHTSSPARLHKEIQTKPDAKANRCSIHIAALPAAASIIDCVHRLQPLEMSCVTEDVSIEEDYSRANAIDENEEKEIRFSPSLPPSPVSLLSLQYGAHSPELYALLPIYLSVQQATETHWSLVENSVGRFPRNPGALCDNRRVPVVAIQP